MQKNKIKKPIKQQRKQTDVKAKIVFPVNKNIFFYSTLALSFLITFILYILTLAPNISFEDSGELVTAAYTLGVPHEPGYPLFTIFGKIFSLIIPFGSIAYRVNLASAFFTSLAALLISWATVLIIEDTFITSNFWKKNNEKLLNILKYSIAFSSGLFFGLSFETWEQAVMTEVYGINSCFTALFILLALIWKRQETQEERKKYLYIISFVIALAFTNHTTSLMLIPIFGVFLLAVDYKIILNIKTVAKTILFFILGLTPFLYLPIAASQNPPMNWGNPGNITNFFRVIYRHQYNIDSPHTTERFTSQFKYYLSTLLPEQWYLLFIIFAIIGIFIIYKHNKKYFFFAIMFLLLSMPVTTYFTNFDISSNKLVNIENGALVSVFYIPSYMFLSILTGIGFFYLISIIKTSPKILYAIGCLCIIMAFSNTFKNYKKTDMSQYYYPQKYVENVFKVATPNSIVIGDWDPFCFPYFYFQYVENKRKDIVALDIMLLKRSWYIEMLKHNHPDFIKRSQTEVDNFLKAVEPFENGEQYDGNVIQSCYENMIYSFIDKNLANKEDVYITFLNNNEAIKLLNKYQRESILAAYKIPRDTTLSQINFDEADYDIFINDKNPDDRMVKRFKEYYGGTFATRGLLYESLKNKTESLKYYNLSLQFFKNNKSLQNTINQRIQALKSN
ncbi:MAG TPA: DUF2723 domain-containing protein [Bacteroidales bacterium]|nr:DUF2723 domain-containing protein [Bacteroidales bacterium]HPS16174.1 DUF2723 domain-containing protein [Bacteroidales bacterium]